jgi:hypothetical protein
MGRLVDLDYSFENSEGSKIWEPTDLSNSVSKMVKARENIKSHIEEAIDASFNFGYELGEASLRGQIADKLDNLIKKSEQEELLVNEVLAVISTLLVKEQEGQEEPNEKA